MAIITPKTLSGQANPVDPCAVSSSVAANPNRFAVVSVDHKNSIRYKFEVRLDSPETLGALIQEFVFDKGQMIEYPGNCFVTPVYTLGPSAPRDGVTKYVSRYMIEAADTPSHSDWSIKSVPFVLTPKLRVGAISNRFIP